jgi:hypothetical protein
VPRFAQVVLQKPLVFLSLEIRPHFPNQLDYLLHRQHWPPPEEMRG